MARKSMVVLYGVSFAIHASLGVGVTEIEPSKEPERVAITVVDVPKPKEKPKAEEPPPPPPPPPPPVVEAPKKAAPKPKAEAPPPVDIAPVAAPTFGIAMTGGAGLGGIAVPVGDSLNSAAPKEAPVKRVAEAKTLVEPKKPSASACDEEATKPKPIVMAKPEYTEEARTAQIEGKVRVEITVDASGAVKNVKVLESLGHGLDEAAIRAVQAASFEPAQQCGKPVSATFVVGIRFSL